MDYGDEFNDDEERRYKEETYGKGRSARSPGKKDVKEKEDDENSEEDEAEEGEEEDEEGEDESYEEEPVNVVPLAKEFSRRANRGTRMTALVGKA